MEREAIIMNLVFKQWLLAMLTRLLIIVIIANTISLSLLWFLPGEGVEYVSTHSTQPEYHRYRVKGMLQEGMTASGERRSSSDGGPSSAPVQEISSLLLQGLYGNKDSGIVVIAKRATPTKTEVIASGEQYGGYTLVGVDVDSAIFTRNGKEYRLMMQDADKTPVLRPRTDVVENNSDDLDTTRVSREEVTSYAKNVDRLWKDISIVEVREDGKIKGFKVTRIKAGTPLARLGLKRGDILIKANNKRLRSYAAALDIYKKIDTLQALQLVVLRNNQEKEIVYEIY